MNKIPSAEFAALMKNTYPGRGIVVGLNDEGTHLVQVYWIMGRSEDSRNRVLSAEGGRVFTEYADPFKSGNSKLLIYNVMSEIRGYFVVSNGRQTDDVIRSVRIGVRSFADVMLDCKLQYEPDAPNYTPRITAMCSIRNGPPAQMCVLKKSLFKNACQRHFFSFDELDKGLGFCITTYLGDGDPLPAFCGEPYLVPLLGDIEQIAEFFWSILDPENKVALVVKFIEIIAGNSEVHILNKYKRV
jgi:IMP cyclohydrolase